MSQPGPSEFGRYLFRAMALAGYDSPSAMARAAGLEPSVIIRWIHGTTAPTLRTLARVAPLLKVSAAELITAAYGDMFDPAEASVPLATELAVMLAPDSPLAPEDRHVIEVMVDRFLEPYRVKLREARAAGFLPPASPGVPQA